MSSDRLAPDMVAIWDQRAADARVFIDRIMADSWVRSKIGSDGLVDSVGVAALSFAIDRLITERREVNDALAIALIKLSGAQ